MEHSGVAVRSVTACERRRVEAWAVIAERIALLTRARAIDPRDPEVALDLARLYLRTGMIESALTLLAALAPAGVACREAASEPYLRFDA